MSNLLARIRGGDTAAFDDLVRTEWSGLVRFAERLVTDAATAEDVAQEAFVRLWERRERWQGDRARPLLFVIARNAALDALRRRRVRNSAEARHEAFPDRGARPDEDLAARDLADRVRAAVETLPPRRREVFELVRVHGLSYAETAEVVGSSPQTVANHMSLALRDLRSLLAPASGGSREARRKDESERSDNG